MNTLKKDWKESLGIRHILLTVKCLLIVPNPESALNEEAGRMLLEQYEVHRYKMYSSLENPASEMKCAGICKACHSLDRNSCSA